MIKSLNNDPIHALLSPENNVVFSIPKYQREYSWGVAQWEDLVNDLLEAGPNGQHFMGTIICVNATVNTTAESVLEVIDGQQRLTTISLLLSALYAVIKESQQADEIGDFDEDELNADIVNLKKMLVLKSNQQPRLRPQAQNFNALDYGQVLKKAGLLKDAEDSPYAWVRRVIKGFNYFYDRIKTQAEENKEIPLKTAFDMLESLKKATVVKIEVETQADAFVLFESLNNRGMPLTPIDLIKNTLLGKADRAGSEVSLDETYERWKQWVGILGDEYSTQERFFRYYYNAMKDVKEFSVSGATVATRSNIIKIYETLIATDLQKTIRDISEGVKAFGLLIGSIKDENYSDELLDAFKRLARAQGAPAHILLMYLLMEQQKLSLSDSDIRDIADLLTSFFVRRNITGYPATYALPKIFMDLITQVRSAESPDLIKELIVKRLLATSASDDAFREILSGPVYETNSDAIRFVLVSLEEEYMTKETHQDLWKRDASQSKPTYVWSIEHILPQSDKLKPGWVEMLGGDETIAREIQEKEKHRLGNLTITGYNSNLSNREFLAKRDHRDGEGRFIGYKNKLSLNRDLANAETWNQDAIEKRTQELIEQTLRRFPLAYR